MIAPSVATDPRHRQWWADYLRQGASPGAGVALYRMNVEVDIRHVLPAIRVPTLILHRAGDHLINVGSARYMAGRIPNAEYVELAGEDHLPYFGDADSVLSEIQEFLTGVRPPYESDRVLATVLFVDIVRSTERAAAAGDARWRDVLTAYQSQAGAEIARFKGKVIDTAGDGVFAIFDGPARTIRCAHALQEAMRPLGLALRAGLHTGECEMAGAKVMGLAVHIAARIAGMAESGEILVSTTVRDLVAGSGLHFEDRGSQVLKGVPGEWRLFTSKS